MGLDDNRLVRAFAELHGQGRHTLVPFLTAGFPTLEITGELLPAFETLGVRVCELGIPFTDPIADGPTIQASYTEALAAGMTTGKIFDMVRRYREAGGGMAMVAMVTYSIVFRHGPEQFVAQAKAAGFDGLIIPDLPIDESGDMERVCTEQGIALVLLISPTTPEERQEEIARRSRGFLYYMSVAGITGERTALPDQTIQAVARLREHTTTPICVGFGISNPETVANVCKVADGAIVGSAIVRRLLKPEDPGHDEIISSVLGFVETLLQPVL